MICGAIHRCKWVSGLALKIRVQYSGIVHRYARSLVAFPFQSERLRVRVDATKLFPIRTPHLCPLPFFNGRGENTTTRVGQTILSASLNGALKKCAPVEFRDPVQRNFAGPPICNAHRSTNRALDTHRLPSAQIPQSAHGQTNSAYEMDRDSPPRG